MSNSGQRQNTGMGMGWRSGGLSNAMSRYGSGSTGMGRGSPMPQSGMTYRQPQSPIPYGNGEQPTPGFHGPPMFGDGTDPMPKFNQPGGVGLGQGTQDFSGSGMGQPSNGMPQANGLPPGLLNMLKQGGFGGLLGGSF